ncbi:MAG: hypothetical protein SPH68_00175 [Candidatus Borkfalkiaceae bacterium]|nr:hypothetical protein [Clostridia bacterium]MDY6222564.1 hypothetical protein [Christensenellaceae bacterium]
MKKWATLLLSGVMSLALFSGCGGGSLFQNPGDADYNRYPTDYDPDVNSWEQIDPSDDDVSITWFMDVTWGNQFLEELIYKRTGVRVTFQVAINNTHDELNTMIAGGKLPDIITTDNLPLRVQLAEEGYCYAINKLAESYAPSLLNRISQEHMDYYKSSDGNTYCVAHNFYNDADVAEFKEMGGEQYANGGLLVRKDWLNAYLDYKKKENPAFDADKEVTKPSGFIEMCKWVKNKFSIPNSVSTVLFSEFPTTAMNDIISQSLTALTEFMGVPLEDGEGNLVYQYATEEFQNVMKFINELYRNKLIFSGNFAYDTADITQQIVNGKVFAFVGNDQSYRSAFVRREMTAYDKATDTVPDSAQYVPIILTNEEGDAPILLDFAGRGQNLVMITKNCKREDRVIKVIDYLMSEQGMREILYGETEGEWYNYTLRPGETDPVTGKPSTYGRIELTDKGKNAVANGLNQSTLSWGVGRLSVICNPMYARMVTADDGFAGIVAPYYWTMYNNKKAYFGYTASRANFRYPLDVSDRKALNKHVDRQADVEKVWIEALPKMIMANSEDDMMKIYQDALAKSYQRGAEEWMAFRNKCFKTYKEKTGVKYAWPKNDPAYVAPEVKLFGNADKYMDRPSWVYGGV